MVRCLTILLIGLLMVSHGTMSQAMPHMDGDALGLTSDHHHDHEAPAAPDDKSDGMPQVAHVHFAADVGPDYVHHGPVLVSAPLVTQMTPRALASRAEAPPIRPPAA